LYQLDTGPTRPDATSRTSLENGLLAPGTIEGASGRVTLCEPILARLPNILALIPIIIESTPTERVHEKGLWRRDQRPGVRSEKEEPPLSEQDECRKICPQQAAIDRSQTRLCPI
jgi:hypothetical protein